MTQTAAQIRPLNSIFRDHLDNTVECGEVLGQLFANLQQPEALIGRIRQLEEQGDRLTREAHGALDSMPYSDAVQVTQQLVHHLDDIVDGMNNVARIIDILTPQDTQDAAHQLLVIVMAMLERLKPEISQYPNNEFTTVKECRDALKGWEEEADTLYHQWRKAHRRNGSLSLISESDWTEILGILEQTTDACYHSVLALERIARYRARQTG